MYCSNCGTENRESAAYCIECAKPVRPHTTTHQAGFATNFSAACGSLLAIVGVVYLLIFLSSVFSRTRYNDPPALQVPQVMQIPLITTEPRNAFSSSDLTLATADEFSRIRTGMGYAEVCGIIGGSGELLSESDFADIHTVMYQWWGEGMPGANMNAMFQNGCLVQKSQFGLE